MLILTTESIPGKNIIEVKGLVRGSTIRAKHIGKDIGASFKQLVGGELTGYDEMLVEARKIAIARMVEDAKAQGANAIIGFRLTSAAVMQGAAEMLAYGTGVVIDE
ncbi:YbjQ family protein [Romboutsia sp. 1001713B170131_170501_G6]|uniref:YbjQ family protein n=1 Tax=Romboutsia sp. 1001713B170131_170501_G6 TaxID=2787108 RepID=UPI0018AA5B23|nr:heavy metal-binding domain-containing protein [Romboutsia sp. 1001713B170131_170501_G6]